VLEWATSQNGLCRNGINRRFQGDNMPRSRQTHIFATRNDLLPGARRAERELAIKYVRSDGLREDRDFEEYASLESWKELGQNTTGDHVGGYSLLVVPKRSRIEIRRILRQAGTVASVFDELLPTASRLLLGGEVRYALDQLKNPQSVSFLPGGIFEKKNVLVCGHIGTASNDPKSVGLYKAFVTAITKGFERIGAYRVGPEAVRLMDEGYRMVTIGVGSPREYDLRRSGGPGNV
jgi:hypothetical protein